MSLLVKPLEDGSLSKTWSQRLYIDGKPAMIGLGTYPIVTLADVRKAALANRRTLAQCQSALNIDPVREFPYAIFV